ncbi:Predicted dehydrogenase [Thermoflexibacter ruber]|uniref:Predicted dehydrogenase n=2 Tax=Thermoflexibacter ruber TaxID=1003 RepID=A0A1I2JLP4_9BACT|nr:Predicted dehydrogenase [Thermoflexibacter ruber]
MVFDMAENMKPIRVGLACYGMSGSIFHAPLLSVDKRFVISKIVERNTEKSRQKYPYVSVVKSFDEILKDESIDLVVVNTPNQFHFEQGKAVLMAGKHLILEKPVTNFSWEAQDLIELANAKNLIFSVFHNRRYDGDFKTIKSIVQNKLLGDLVVYEAHYDRFRNYIAANTWKEEEGVGSGIVYNLGSHLIDQALHLFGMPQSITAKIGKQRRGSQVDDFYEIYLDYQARANGLQVLLKSSYLVREATPKYLLHGSFGSFVKYGIDPQEEALNNGILPNTPHWGREDKQFWGKLNTEIAGLHYEGHIETLAGSYPDFYTNIYEAIREGKPLAIKAEDAYNTIKIIELAYQSNQEDKTIYL